MKEIKKGTITPITMKEAMIKKETVLGILKTIRHELWLIDIPNPSCPEYKEHHNQVQSVMRTVDFWIKKIMEINNNVQDTN